MQQSPQLVYIAGRGHSGSTVLDALLGNLEGVTGLGELISGWLSYERRCSCGASFETCPFWREVRSAFDRRSDLSWDQAGDLCIHQAYVLRYLQTLMANHRRPPIQNLQRVTEQVVEAVSEVTGDHLIIDSSKEVTRALFLARFTPRSRIIHLVRHPDAVVASFRSRIEDGSGFIFLRRTFRGTRLMPLLLILSCFNWVAGNLLVEIAKAYAPQRYLRVRYEDLCADPRTELRRIGSFLGVDTSPLLDAIDRDCPLDMGHKIAGNRIRQDRSFTFQPRLGKPRPLGRFYSGLIRCVAAPLLWRYGYLPAHPRRKCSHTDSHRVTGDSDRGSG